MTTKTKIPPAPTWDLDSIFPGGAKSPEFKKHREKTLADLKQLRTEVDGLSKALDDSSAKAWTDFILKLQDTVENIEVMISFPHCLISANVKDNEADACESEGIQALSEWETIESDFFALAMSASDEAWEKLVTSDKLVEVRFYLDERRDLMRKKMAPELESLALELSVTGYHAWNQLYDKMAGELLVDFEEDGKTSQLSLGQLATKMGEPDRAIRKQAFEKMTEAWETREDLAAMTLNAQAGFRLTLYKRRGWDSPLFEPLNQARLSREALEAMWSAISRESHRLEPYIEAKKKLLGIDKYRWYDEFAPCGKTDRLYPYDEAADFIVKHVGSFSDEMAAFFRSAIDKRWIEAEDRPGKRGGGYCTGMGPFRQRRIFMTYAGSYENLLTLAHELGHAYHGEVLKTKPFFANEYPMTLAETASIFSELLVTDAALRDTDDPQTKLMLIDQVLQGAYVMFCDIYTRYLFDCTFYEERKKGVVGKDRLNQIMIESQKKAYGRLLDESGHHPLFWASKLHFFVTDAPFYHYPYTFGYMFAGGVYARAKAEGPAFAQKYKALLADTGSMTSDDVARKHLGVDLKMPEFWNDAVERSLSEVDTFVKLVDSL